jgi:hypothetical protein
MLTKLFNTYEGKVIISIILGLGLASVFRQVCHGSQCVVIKGPNTKEINESYYKIEDECYKYSPSVVDCKKP